MKKTNTKKKTLKTNSKTKKTQYRFQGNELIHRKDCKNVLASFEKGFKNTYSTKEFVKLLLSKFAPSHITAKDDYYSFINYKWLQNIAVNDQQKYITQIDDFRLAQDKVYHQLHDIVIEYIRKNPSLPHAKNMERYYKSVLRMNSPKQTREISKKYIETLNKLFHEGNPWKLLGILNREKTCNFHCPFVLSIAADEKNSKIFRPYIYPHTFQLVDISVYDTESEKSAYKTRYRATFRQYCRKLFDTLLGKGHGFQTDDIFDVEVSLYNAFLCPKVQAPFEDAPSSIKISAKNKYGFHWSEFCKYVGFKHTPDFFFTSDLGYLTCGTELFLKSWNTEKWRAYWAYIKLTGYCRYTRGWEKIYYDFFGNFERGQERINETDAVSASLYMSLPYNNFFTKKYVEKYADPAKISYVNTLCNDLLEVFKKIVEKNSWLQPTTKRYALDKLHKLTFTTGYPEMLLDDPHITYGTSLIENLEKISHYYTDLYLSLNGKEVIDLPEIDWTQYPVKFIGNQAYIVNASYTPSKNGIYINLGYIQEPFVDLEERGIEYNLAHLGFTIGHEMSHSLDDWGSQYDAYGNLHDWWTAKDKTKFKEIQQDVIRQYEEFAKRDGIDFDASIGVGEDLADISGLEICNHYLKDFQDKNNDIIPIRNVSYETFYIYYAFQQKQKVVKKALAAQLKTNPHPLDKYRCNIPLSRSDIFRGVYNVQKGDGMWWHNTNTIWN